MKNYQEVINELTSVVADINAKRNLSLGPMPQTFPNNLKTSKDIIFAVQYLKGGVGESVHQNNRYRNNDNGNIISLEQLYQKGSVKVSELSKELGVHEETIRRDLKALAAKWDIKTVYGGAVLKNTISSPAVQEINMLSKRGSHYGEKQIIARKAAALIQPGQTIGLNSGSSVEYILDYIEGKQPLNIVTLNIHIAAKGDITIQQTRITPQTTPSTASKLRAFLEIYPNRNSPNMPGKWHSTCA